MFSRHRAFLGFLTSLLFCLIVLLLLGLLDSMRSIPLLGFALLGCMGLLRAVPQFMLVGLLYLLLFRIVFG